MPRWDIGNQFVGAEQFVGDDMDALLAAAGYDIGYDPVEIGAMSVNPALARSRMMQAALAQRQAQAGALLQSRGATKAREWPLGFDSVTNVAAAANARITARPQVPFRVDRVIIPSDIAGSFTLDDLIVGKNSQFAAAGAIPARVFQENGVGVSLKGDTAQVSQDVVMSATNISGGALRFRAAIVGPAVE